MDEQSDKEIAGKKQRDQMLKLVAKGFYNELTNYGVRKHRSSTWLRTCSTTLATEKKPAEEVEYYNGIFTLSVRRDEWADCKQLAVQYVTLRPLQLAGRQQGHRVAKGPGCPRKLRAAVSGNKSGSCESISPIRHGNISASTTMTNW
jgi:hypothetical protein